jgi:hypothetical protein
MSTPAASLPAGTPREVASSITRAWLLYFVVHAGIMIAVNLALGSVYGILLSSLASNPWLMRIGYVAVGLVVNAPISFVLFQWAVRGNVVPAMLYWAQPADPAVQIE